MEKATFESSDKASQGFPKVPKFLSILFQILEERKHTEYISWSPDGKIVVINKPVEFAEELLPVYFKHSNYSSFVRQLNLYNFRKKKHCPQENAFAHSMFLRGRRDLLQYVKRKTSNINQDEKPCMPFELCGSNDGEYDEMINQNKSLKRVQEDMAQKIQNLEKTINTLTNENDDLQHQCKKKKQNEHFLKKVVNHIARIHGRRQITDLIEAIAYESLGSKLSLKSESERFICTKPRETHRYEKNTPSFMREDFLLETQDFTDKSSYDYSTLHTPFLQTLASVSTIPEFEDSFKFQSNFDQMVDQKLRQQPNPSDLDLNSKYGLDDFLCFDENPSQDVMLGRF